MSNSFFMPFKQLIFFIVFLIVLLCFFFIPTIDASKFIPNNYDNSYSFVTNNIDYLWPTPGYTTISSYFGKRSSPTAGASSYHKGIDIAAPQGTKLIAITSGKITYTGFLGGGGYTITLTSNSMKITYCHVSPTYIVKKGDIVQKGDVIRSCWS